MNPHTPPIEEPPRITNKHGLSETQYQLVQICQRLYNKGKCDFSATQLLKPPQEVAIVERNPDLPVDALELWPATVGTMLHLAMEHLWPTGTKEKRLYANVGEHVISAQLDNIYDGKVKDFKFVGNYSAKGGLKDDWVAQVNIQRWLARKNGIKDECGELSMMNIGTSVNGVIDRGDTAGEDYNIPEWTTDQTEEYIQERINLILAARAAGYIKCSDKERWASKQWRVVKKARGRAVRVFDTEREARRYAETHGHKVERDRDAKKNMRCAHFCRAASLCPQWKAIREGTSE